jgi:iron(III) transport system substrate-binding protein
VMVADVGAYRRLVDDKMIMNHRVPNDADIPAKFKIDGYAYVTYLTTTVVVVNDKLVSQEEGAILREWEGILDPRWKGRIGTTYPAGGGVYGPLYMYLRPPTPGRFGEKFLRGVAAQQPQIFNSTATAIERVISGEIHVLFTHFEADAIPKWRNGAPIRWYAPKPTPSFGNTYFGIAAKAPHPNAAKLWLNWLLSEDGATAFNKVYASISTLSTHKDQRDLPTASWYMPITETFTPDLDGWIKYQDADVKLWREIFNYKPGR